MGIVLSFDLSLRVTGCTAEPKPEGPAADAGVAAVPPTPARR
jgi:hypothetical protein